MFEVLTVIEVDDAPLPIDSRSIVIGLFRASDPLTEYHLKVVLRQEIFAVPFHEASKHEVLAVQGLIRAPQLR